MLGWAGGSFDPEQFDMRAANAAILAAQILAVSDEALAKKLQAARAAMRSAALEADRKLAAE